MNAQSPALKVGQVWRDEDGARWRIVGFGDNGWPYLRPKVNPTANAIMTNPAWFRLWALEGRWDA